MPRCTSSPLGGGLSNTGWPGLSLPVPQCPACQINGFKDQDPHKPSSLSPPHRSSRPLHSLSVLAFDQERLERKVGSHPLGLVQDWEVLQAQAGPSQPSLYPADPGLQAGTAASAPRGGPAVPGYHASQPVAESTAGAGGPRHPAGYGLGDRHSGEGHGDRHSGDRQWQWPHFDPIPLRIHGPVGTSAAILHRGCPAPRQ